MDTPPDSKPTSLFSDNGLPATPTPVRPPKGRPKKLLVAVVMPLAILLLGIAVIAWVAQYLPGRGRPVPQPQGEGTILFAKNNSLPTDKPYLPEYELGVDGFYDFEFTNTNTSDMELGIGKTSCACTSVLVCVFKNAQDKEHYTNNNASPQRTWKAVEVDEELGKRIVIPAQASGVMRVTWKGNRTEPEQLKLQVNVWIRAPGGARRPLIFTAWANYIHPVRFDQPGQQPIDLGLIGPKEQRSATFYAWSPTRDVEVKSASDDKCFLVDVVPLGPTECADLQKKLEQQRIFTQVRSAAKINLRLLEENDGNQLDIGLILKPVALTITSKGEKIDVPVPMIKAHVLGDVSLGPPDDGNRIDFNFFSAKKGKTKKVTLFAPKDAKVTFVECQPALVDIEAELSLLKTAGGKSQWEMTVTAKPNRDPGPLPEHGVLVLRCDQPATANAPAVSRLVHIPVIGTASGQGST